jgi:hypothetical protein
MNYLCVKDRARPPGGGRSKPAGRSMKTREKKMRFSRFPKLWKNKGSHPPILFPRVNNLY